MLLSKVTQMRKIEAVKPGSLGTGWKTCRESMEIVQSGQNKSLNTELCCMLRKKAPDLLNIV